MKASGLRRFLRDLGPGLISGAADDDPSGIATFSVAGASFGYLPLWTALFSIPLMIAAQTMSARLGIVSGRCIVFSLVEKRSRLLAASGTVMKLHAVHGKDGRALSAMHDARAKRRKVLQRANSVIL